jgi:hypothetical protein
MLPLKTAQGVAINPGAFNTLASGIQGVAANGLASLNMPTNARYHEIDLQCVAVNYTGGTGLATTALTGSGSGATVTFTSTNGVPGTISIASGGSGYAANDTFSVTDATGTGGVFKVLTVSSGAIATAQYNAGTATASPINPASLLTSLKLVVNGVSVRDISPLYALMIAQANGINPALGDLPLLFSEPWDTVLGKSNTALSWDMIGQQTFQIFFQIASGYLLPGVTANQIYDYQRNQRTPAGGTTPVPNLEPVSHHFFSVPIVGSAGGTVNPVVQVPFNYPIRRIWFIGSSAGNLTNLELLQDNNPRLQSTVKELNQFYARYGFKFGLADYTNQNQTSQKPLGLNPLNYFDAAFISDFDNRYRKALRCVSSLTINVTSTATQQLNIIVESLPGAYQ